jgi:hypothetical protein
VFGYHVRREMDKSSSGATVVEFVDFGTANQSHSIHASAHLLKSAYGS